MRKQVGPIGIAAVILGLQSALLVVILLAFSLSVRAQSANGPVNGTVTDSSGAAISGARVRLTNKGTRNASVSEANPNGYFLFINVLPGTYVLSVEKEGFRKADVSGFEIQVNQTLTQNIRMQVGAATESVTVAAESLLQTSSAELGTVISVRAVQELPLNGHNFTQLLILTPGITPISNNRNGLPGDFSTPEQRIEAAKKGHAWETCMTLNDSWGYQQADDDWKSAKTIVRNLVQCSQDEGNYLLNIGPKPDGSVPEESVHILQSVGEWLGRNGETIYGSEACNADRGRFTGYTQKGNTIYCHVHFWPGDTPAEQWLSFYQPPAVIAMGGLQTKVKSVRMFASGKPVSFEQDEYALRLTGLPATPPDDPVTVIAVECDGEPIIDHLQVRKNRPRNKVGVSWSE